MQVFKQLRPLKAVDPMSTQLEDPNDPVFKRWCLRVLVNLDARSLLAEDGGFGRYYRQEVFEYLGISSNDCQSAGALKGVLVTSLDRFEKRECRLSGVLIENCHALADEFGFSEVEKQLFTLMLVLPLKSPLEKLFDFVFEVNRQWFFMVKALSLVLNESPDKIEAALHSNSVLMQSGMVRLDMEREDFSRRFSVEREARGILMQQYESKHALARALLTPVAAGPLDLKDYGYIERDVHVLAAYFRGVYAGKAKGANVLIYGEPGSGKTEFVKAIAGGLGLSLYEVPGESRFNSFDHEARFEKVKLNQQMLAGSDNALLLFDEIEDVLDLTAQLITKSRPSKLQMNRMLESNAVPTVWVCNQPEVVSPWFLRRFDYVLNMPVPPISVRRKLLETKLSEKGVPQDTLEKLAGLRDVTPAHITRIDKVLGAVQRGGGVDLNDALYSVVDNHRKLSRGVEPFSNVKAEAVPLSMEFYNADIDLSALVARMADKPEGRICLYGPPGTGKTTFARLLAEAADLPLLTYKASDLLGMYVGETEKNIREMFTAAAEENAVLFVDEFDAFAVDRGSVSKNWEASQVNEMLVCMEAFDGLFVAATNYMERMDKAAVRRFHVKLELGYLNAVQRLSIFLKTCYQHELTDADDVQAAAVRVDSLRNLTPGDVYAAVRRMQMLHGNGSATLLADEIVREVGYKETSKPMGFLAGISS